jgi:hypothetical protein
MSQLPDSFHVPVRRRLVVLISVGGAVLVLGAVLLAVLLLVRTVLPQRGEDLRGLPSRFSTGSITYTPETGPSNPTLLDSRPERIVERYLADYIGLAGTFPCLQDLSSPYDATEDPVLLGQSCPVSRPVAFYAVNSVKVLSHGLVGLPEATVRFVINYTDGSQWTGETGLVPDRYQMPWGIYFAHLDCWSSLGTLQMFDNLVPDIPPGAAYSPPGAPVGVPNLCKPASA